MAFKIIHAGFGRWGTNWHKTIIEPFKGVQTVAWVDSDPIALKQISKLDTVDESKCFTGVKAALNEVQADGLVITAGIGGHVPLCKDGLNNGLHVLVEKPFAPRVSAARKLIELADGKGLILMVSQNYRFQPAVRAVEKLLTSGSLGPVYSVSIDFRRNAGIGRKGSEHHAVIDHPLWMDMSIHHYDLMRCLLGGNPSTVTVQNINPPWSEYRDPPAGAFLATYADGPQMSYRGSWMSGADQTPWSGKWVMECEKGTIVWQSRGEDGDESVIVQAKGKKDKTVTLPKLRHIDRSGCLDAFVKAVKNGIEPETSARDNVGTLLFMDAIVKSAKNGRTVTVAE
jgi:predicted dehydrogenase